MTTLLAYRDHGEPESRVADGLDWIAATASQLAVLDIDLEVAAKQLEHEGIAKFKAPFDRLLARIESARTRVIADGSQPLQGPTQTP